MAMRPYVVCQGDYLTKLAHRMGFDAEAVWNDDANSALRARRPNPDILAPGDVLHVPVEPTISSLTLGVGGETIYRAKLPKVTATVIFRHEGSPLSNAHYVIEGLARLVEGTSDSDGRVTVKVPLHVREVRVIFSEQQLAFPVRVGDLDPIDEASGVRQRLAHLGFDGWALGEAVGALRPLSDDGDASAIRAFQRANQLAETGEVDEATREALKKAHGG